MSTSFIGRPTDYKQEYCQLLVEFYCKPSTVEKVRTITTKNGTTIEETFDAPTKPTHVVDFCDEINIAISTFYRWIEMNPEFSEAYAHAKKYLERNVVDNALLNNYNGGFASLVSKNWFNWKDKTETDVTTNGKDVTQPVTQDVLEAFIAKVQDDTKQG